MKINSCCSTGLVFSILTLLQLSTCECVVQVWKFRLIRGQSIFGGGSEIARASGRGLTRLKCAALCMTGCGLFQFSRDLGLCVTFAQRPYEVALTHDPQWDIRYKRFDSELKFGDWTLVFRIQKETSVPSYQTWTQTGRHDDNPMVDSYPLACVSLYNYSSCDRHFRSHILDNWSGISEVYVSVIKNEEEVAFIQFDGTGTKRGSWFHPTRIVNSTWYPDVRNNSELSKYAGISGTCPHMSSQCRRFYLYGEHDICRREWFYLTVFDRGFDICRTDWVRTVPSTPPSIAYSPTPGRASFGISRPDLPVGEFADAMAIYVKFG